MKNNRNATSNCQLESSDPEKKNKTGSTEKFQSHYGNLNILPWAFCEMGAIEIHSSLLRMNFYCNYQIFSFLHHFQFIGAEALVPRLFGFH